MKTIAMIPARYAATRFPAKLMQVLGKKTVIRHTYDNTLATGLFDEVMVVTDSDIIYREITDHGGKAKMSIQSHESGSDRIAEAVANMDVEIVVNVQGDEPLLDPAAVDAAVDSLLEEPQASISTVATPIKTPADIMDPNVVKTVLDFESNALYFSRAPIPWLRDTASKIHVQHLKHLGLYVFQRVALLEYPTLPQGELEKIEQLEQLRWLENGWKIRVAEVAHDAVSVDVPEDVARVEKLLQK